MQPALVALGPFVWPSDAPAGFRPALLGGLARVAAVHPALLEVLQLEAIDLPSWTGPAKPGQPNPTKGQLGKAPLEAMLARIGHAAGPRAEGATELVLAAAALLVFLWASAPQARQKPEIEDALKKAFAAVRHWFEPSPLSNDAFPDGFATLLRQHPQITEDAVPAIVEALSAMATKGTSRLDCFERAVAFLQVESKRRPRAPKERAAQVTTVTPSPAAGATPERAAPCHPVAPAPQGLPALNEAAPTGIATPSTPEAARAAPPPRYKSDLPDRKTREADGARCLRGEPHGRARRAQQATFHTLPVARLDELHAPDWAFLKEWLQTAKPLDAAVVIALLYSGQSPDGLLQCRVAADLSAWANEPDAFGIVMAPFGLVVPNRVNPELPQGSGDDPAAERLFLPLPENAADADPHLLRQLRNECAHRVGGPLCGLDELESLAKRFDADAKVAGSAMRLGRLGRPLERALYNGTGSALIWQYMRNRVPDTAYVPALHYARFELVEIVECHRRACDTIDKLLGIPAIPQPQPDLPWSGSVGSRFCPSDEQVRVQVRALGEDFQGPPRGKPTAAKLAAFHNSLTRYTLALLMTASAVRPSAPGLDSLRPMLLEAGECPIWLISDKPQLGCGGRVVPIAPTALTQWLAYDRHCRWMKEHPLLKSAISQFKREAKQSLPPFFLFGADLHVEPITPRTCASVLAPLKENALRHWMLNALRRCGWTADRIALFAGHAGRVHSPTAPWSTATLWSRADLKDIEHVLANVGWTRRVGMGHD